MTLEDYEKAAKDIMFGWHKREVAKQKFVRLMLVFVQDCHLPIHQPYFGNVTKAKAKVIFDLSEYFIDEI